MRGLFSGRRAGTRRSQRAEPGPGTFHGPCLPGAVAGSGLRALPSLGGSARWGAAGVSWTAVSCLRGTGTRMPTLWTLARRMVAREPRSGLPSSPALHPSPRLSQGLRGPDWRRSGMFGGAEAFGALAADGSPAAPGVWMGSTHSRQFFKLLSVQPGKIGASRKLCLLGAALWPAANRCHVPLTPSTRTGWDSTLPLQMTKTCRLTPRPAVPPPTGCQGLPLPCPLFLSLDTPRRCFLVPLNRVFSKLPALALELLPVSVSLSPLSFPR